MNEHAHFLKMMQDNSLLFAAPFVEGIYEQYLLDRNSVTDEWRAYFDTFPAWDNSGHEQAHSPVQRAFEALPNARGVPDADHERKQVKVLQLINAHRFLGVRVANLDPLNRHVKPVIPELDPVYYGFAETDMDTTYETGSLVSAARLTLREIMRLLRQTYCGSIGAEYMYISDVPQKRWIQGRLEGVRGVSGYDAAQRRRILGRITAAETLERYLHTKYVGQKRFSLEGGETLIPLLDHLLQRAGGQGVKEAVIGMAHRGRLNVLVNILGKQPRMLFAEFEGIHAENLTSGDVKYHQGFSANILTPGGKVHVVLAFNPSHLEIVNPVVEGSVRARQHRLKDLEGNQVIPILIHGDAAFAGQGVVMETLNMSQTRGFHTGGTIHIINNNQIGFTVSDKRDMRSSHYCSDVAKMVDAPIFHVNADDPDAVMLITEIALDYRMQFHRDVVIDLVCFRKLGHNEQDEPLVTQPFMYRHIRRHPGTRALYAQRLLDQGVINAGEADEMIVNYRLAMDQGHNSIQPALENGSKARLEVPAESPWAPFKRGTAWNVPVNTSVPLDRLQQLAVLLTTVPGKVQAGMPSQGGDSQNFALHARVQKIVEDRVAMARDELSLDWGMAENLAYATLLTEGYPVRLSGQDVKRGTFFHRHAAWHDQNRVEWHEGVYIPLQHLAPDQADFAVIDTLLSEEAVLGFEYGYATAEPNSLVLWEAQFGDFANGAQVVIDQFIASGEVKWGRLCGLVMLLPHGYEGQGAEHSSGRIERYLQLCADYNIQVCIPSTPAQMFHLLRRQMLRPTRRPLIVFTPKSLLRSKDAASPLNEFTEGGFRAVIPEVETLNADKVRRIIACSGKVYYDLVHGRRARGIEDMAIIRIEQLYPFPHEDFAAQLAAYPNATEFLWCQEEPGNQGAWHRIQHYFTRHFHKGMRLGYALRPSSAAPAAGYLAVHNEQQKAVIEAAFRPDLDVKNNPGAHRHESH